jgi:peptidoglycan/LPS O-acetylase OafA/YrhL
MDVKFLPKDAPASLVQEHAAPRLDRTQSLGYRPQLDGLRALAWIGVFLAHAELMPFPGVAKVAMYLFFGLSGFLITSLLVEERARTGSISIRRFFIRRALRLLPALVTMLTIWLIVVAIFGHGSWMTTVPGNRVGAPEPFGNALAGVGVAVIYMTNWFDIFHLFSGYVPLGHLWSLAVEEQMYLIFAPLLVVILRCRIAIVNSCLIVLAGCSMIEAIALHNAGDSSWVYSGTDCRAGAFLFGGAFAIMWSRGTLRSFLCGRMGVMFVLGASVGLLLCAVPLSGNRSSFPVAWVCATICGPLLVVAVVEQNRGCVGRILSSKPMVYLGRRSYALYLWHYLFLTWFRSLGHLGIAYALCCTLIASEISWRVVERRFLRRKVRFSSL